MIKLWTWLRSVGNTENEEQPYIKPTKRRDTHTHCQTQQQSRRYPKMYKRFYSSIEMYSTWKLAPHSQKRKTSQVVIENLLIVEWRLLCYKQLCKRGTRFKLLNILYQLPTSNQIVKCGWFRMDPSVRVYKTSQTLFEITN